MIRRNLILLIVLFISCGLVAQETADTTKPWKITGEAGLSFSQVSLTNWSAGGESSISGNSLLNINATYSKDKSIWTNVAELGFGLLKQGDEDLKKTDDKLYLASSYSYQAAKKWYYNATLSFRSQFASGYNYPNDSVIISKFLAPAYIIAALGMEFRPDENFNWIMSPFSGRLIIVNDDTLSAQGAFGVDPGNKTRLEFGASTQVFLKVNIMKNVDFQTTLGLFSNYLEDPQNIDINWEMALNMKINDYLAASINTTLIYDHDIKIEDKDGNIGPRTQFKEVLGIGFSYKF